MGYKGRISWPVRENILLRTSSHNMILMMSIRCLVGIFCFGSKNTPPHVGYEWMSKEIYIYNFQMPEVSRVFGIIPGEV